MVRPRQHCSEDVVLIANPDYVISRDVPVLVSFESFHEPLGKDC